MNRENLKLEIPREILDTIPTGETRLVGRLTVTAKGEGLRARKGTVDEATNEIYGTKDNDGNVSFSVREVQRITGAAEQATGIIELGGD